MNKLSVLLLVLVCLAGSAPAQQSGLFPVKEFGKWGYINSSGKIVIPCLYDEASWFSEGLAAVLIDTLYGFIDTAGKLVLPARFSKAARFSDGLCKVAYTEQGKYREVFIRMDGTLALEPAYPDVGSFHHGLAYVKINEEVCFLDKTGKIAINTHFSYCSGTISGDGITYVWKGDSSEYIDTAGKVVAACAGMGNDDFSEGLARVQIGDSTFYLDKSGNIKIRPAQQELTYFAFSDGMARAVLSGSNFRTGFIDTTGNVVIPLAYRHVEDFKEGLAAFYDHGKWGFMDKQGNIIIPPRFEQMEQNGFYNGLCSVKEHRQWGYIDRQGVFVWKAVKDLYRTKLERSRWSLDTLNINLPMESNTIVEDSNYSDQKGWPALTDLSLSVDTADITVYADKYFAYKIYLINGSEYPVQIPAQDGRIKIIEQAINKKGKWQDIQHFYNSFCGNSYHSICFAPGDFQVFPSPVFKGDFETRLRFRLELGNRTIYSNIFNGRINKSQFLKPQDKDRTRIAVWTN